jgi:hypothetical protein
MPLPSCSGCFSQRNVRHHARKYNDVETYTNGLQVTGNVARQAELRGDVLNALRESGATLTNWGETANDLGAGLYHFTLNYWISGTAQQIRVFRTYIDGITRT